MTLCNNCFFNLPLSASALKAKDLDVCTQILAKYLAFNDYIDPEAEIKEVLHDLEIIKCYSPDKDAKTKIDAKILPDNEEAKSDGSWVI